MSSTPRPSRPALPATVLTLFLLVSRSLASLVIDVEGDNRQCFATYVEAPSIVSGNFDVILAESDRFRVQFYGPDGTKIYSSDDGDTEGSFSATGIGRFELCFENDHDQEENVGFSLRIFPIAEAAKEGEPPVDPTTKRLEETSRTLLGYLDALADHQSAARTRETRSRNLAENIFSRVVRWTLLEAAVLVAVAGGQVAYLHRFFDKRRNF